MARRFVSGFLPDYDDVILLEEDATPPAWAFPATTTVDSHAPPSGGRWLKVTAPGSTTIIPDLTVTPKAWAWFCLRGLVVEGTLSPGTNPFFLRVSEDNTADTVRTVNFEIKPTSSSAFVLRVTTGGGRVLRADGTVSMGVDDLHNIRAQWGTDGSFKVWVNGTLDIDVTPSDMDPIVSRRIFITSVDLGSNTIYLNGGVLCDSDSEADRPGTAVSGDRADTDDNYAGEDEYGDETTCDSADADHEDVDLDGADQVDTSIYWCAKGANAEKQMAEMTTASPTGDLLGIVVRGANRANAAAKTVETYYRIHDGANSQEQQNTNISVADWMGAIRVFEVAPDGGAWTSGDLASLKMGVRTIGTNTADENWAALIAEVFAIDSDPPAAAATDRRRNSAQVT